MSLDVKDRVLFPPGLVFTFDGEIVELGTGEVKGTVYLIPSEFCFHRTPTRKPLGTFYPSKYEIIDKTNYEILKKIVRDRAISEIVHLSKGEKISRLRADPDSIYNTPEYRLKNAEAVRRWWTPERKKIHGLKMIEVNRRSRSKRSEALKKENSPERADRISESLTSFWLNPRNKRRQTEAIRRGRAIRNVGMVFESMYCDAPELIEVSV